MSGEIKKNPPELDGVPDLSQLLYLEMPNVVHNLKCRYDQKKIYTGISSILLALNPYQTLSCYGQEAMEVYSSKAKHAKAEPHVYDVAEDAYRALCKSKENQSMIVCGESGAGKSESAKHLMRHLAYTTSKSVIEYLERKGGTTKAVKGSKRRDSIRRLSLSMSSIDASGIQKMANKTSEELEKKVLRILAANPILEAFGNAKTVLNNNSSRFGKFTKLMFSEDEKNGVHIVGSTIETFLLEKSRVNFQTKGERNYHIFYQMINGLDDEMKKKLGLEGGCKSFYYTSQSGCDTVPGIPDKERFDEFMSSLTLAGFSDSDIDGILRVVAAILHMSNISFTVDEKENCDIAAESKAALAKASGLLGVTPEAMAKCMCFRTLKIGGQIISKPYNATTSIVNRDSMCRALFSKMFDWVVKSINKVMLVGNADKLKWIGILDVFGFECFAYNSFEQLCINLANERLQDFFNVHVIKSEQEEYQREAIYWKAVNIPDNQKCLDMVLKKTTGLLAILDSACQTPKADDKTFTTLLFKQFYGHPSIKQVRTLPGTKGRSKVSINGFLVRHYARDVCYDAKEFLLKNVDSTHEDTVNLFRDTGLEVAYKLMHGDVHEEHEKSESKRKPGRGKAKKKKLSIGGGFAKQLRLLMKALESTRPFFIRCVKPNLAKKPSMWVDVLVTNQLEAGGLIQALKIIKMGYPTRVGYKTIYSKYSKVLTNPPPDLNERDFVEALIIAYKFNRSQFVLGLTKAFFKSDQQDFVTSLLNPKNDLSEEIVKGIRSHLVQKKVVRSMAVVKAVARWKFLELRRQKRKAVFAIQALAMSLIARDRVRQKRAATGVELKKGVEALYAMDSKTRKVVEAVCNQAANWLATVSHVDDVPKGLKFLEDAATGSALCQALFVLGCPTTCHSDAQLASSAARDNCTDFLHGCKELGVKKAHLATPDDLFLLKRPLHALDTILNLCLVTKTGIEAFPTVSFELSEAKRKGTASGLSKGMVFLRSGGVLDGMDADRTEELFNPGFIARKREKEEKERQSKIAAEKARKKKEAEERRAQAAAKKAAEAEAERIAREKKAAAAAAAAAAAEAEASAQKQEAIQQAAKAASSAMAAAPSAVVETVKDAAQPMTIRIGKKPEAKQPVVKGNETDAKEAPPGAPPVREIKTSSDVGLPKQVSTKNLENIENALKSIKENEDQLEGLKSHTKEAMTELTAAEKTLQQERANAKLERSPTETERNQAELQEFIKKSKPFVSMLVTLLRKYSQTGMLKEVGLTWRDFPPMTLFETADAQGVEPAKWSEWIWDFVNDRIHTERLKLLFNGWIGTVKRSDGALDLQYGSITTSVTIELCKALIGEYRPKILSQLQSGAIPGRNVQRPSIKKGGGLFFSAAKKEEENLVTLKLVCNYIGSDAVPSLANLVTQVITIEELWLCGNPIGDQGVEHLCFGLQQAAQLGAADGGGPAPLLNKLYLQSCSITREGYTHMARFLSTYPHPLVVFMSGNDYKTNVPTTLASRGAKEYQKHAITLNSLGGKLRQDCINVVVKYYERILKHPKTAKWRRVSLSRACRYSDKKDMPQAESWWASNLLANGFEKDGKSKKDDEYTLDEREKVSWEGITWSLTFAQTLQVTSETLEVEARMFNLFQDLLVRVGTPYTGTIEKEHIFDELRSNLRLRHELKLNKVDFETFQERFSDIDKVKGGLMKIKNFVEYAAAFRTTLENFQRIFGKYQNAKGEVEKQALFKALKNDTNVRKYFGIKKFHYKAFNDLFRAISFRKQSMSLTNMVDFQVQQNKKKMSQAAGGRRRSVVGETLAAQIPTMSEPPRVVVRVGMPDKTYITMAAFGDWTLAKVRGVFEQKMKTRGVAAPKSYVMEMEGQEIKEEEDSLWRLAFTVLKQFPKIITLGMRVNEFDGGAYLMTVRTNMRREVSVQSDKIVTLEKGDLVRISEIIHDPDSKAIRGLVKPAEGWMVGERVLYSYGENKAISARVTSVSPLKIHTAESRSIDEQWRNREVEVADDSALAKAEGWISLRSSAGQVCVNKQVGAE